MNVRSPCSFLSFLWNNYLVKKINMYNFTILIKRLRRYYNNMHILVVHPIYIHTRYLVYMYRNRRLMSTYNHSSVAAAPVQHYTTWLQSWQWQRVQISNNIPRRRSKPWAIVKLSDIRVKSSVLYDGHTTATNVFENFTVV